ncbi:phospholipase B1, membrane-associated isoform X1 [Anguilla anguilla]|uniref:phospholipase B1, membrane-associated isoform X1 n=1 Tax=Anguilla anguilla TaxID=7936 RepID=UPI0015ACED55|nr:phospholipase B1, membrane-associated isoform X1 [Anguilla anguilla]
MRRLSIAVVICIFASCLVKGNSWWEDYEEGKKHYSEEALNKEFPEKTRPQGFSHPPFQCPDMSPSPTNPSSVELVKAADIRVIAAMGDSLTTAIAANASNVLQVPIEYRQVSWSIGGYGTIQDVITLANIVKLFNPNVLGPAPVMTFHGVPTTINETGFNLAVTGHNTLNFSEQARHLIDTLKSYPGLNFTEDWKLATVLIGMNDICDYCKNKTLFSVDNFIHYMAESLDMMMNEVPRMIVNVVQIMTMEPLREVQRPTVGCLLQKSFCSCLTTPPSDSPELKELVELNFEFQRRLEKLLHSDRYFKEDFAVVLQPYLKNAQPPRLPNGNIDMSFFAPDCFHFTIKGHEELAKGLWNNMFQPEGEKFLLETFSEPIKLICPSEEHPYIYTRPHRPTSSSPTLSSSLQLWLFLSLLTVTYIV